MTSTKKKPRQKRRNLRRFELKSPSAGSILDVAEDAAINKAINKATRGGKR